LTPSAARHRIQLVSTWLILAADLIALAVSIYALVVSRRNYFKVKAMFEARNKRLGIES
jgi:heme exporter protein D